MESPRVVSKVNYQQRKKLPRPSATSLDQILNLNVNSNGKRKWNDQVVPIKSLNVKRNRSKVNSPAMPKICSSKSSISSLSSGNSSGSDARESKRPKTTQSNSSSFSSSNSRSRATVYKILSRSPSSQTTSSESSNDFDDFQKPRAVPRRAVHRSNKYVDTSAKSRVPLSCSKTSSNIYLVESPSTSMPRKRSRLYSSIPSKVDCKRSSSDESKSSTKKKSSVVKKSIKKSVVRRLNSLSSDELNTCNDNTGLLQNSETSELEDNQAQEYFRLRNLVKKNDQLVCGVLSPDKNIEKLMKQRILKDIEDSTIQSRNANNAKTKLESNMNEPEQTVTIDNKHSVAENSDLQCSTTKEDVPKVLPSFDIDEYGARSTSSFYSGYDEEHTSLNTSTCSLKSENLSSECEPGLNAELTSSSRKISQITPSPRRDPTTPKSWTTNRSFFLRATENRRKLHKREWESKKTKFSSERCSSSRHKNNPIFRELTEELSEAKELMYLQENEIQSLRLEIEWARDGAAEDERTRTETEIVKINAENESRMFKARIEELEQQLLARNLKQNIEVKESSSDIFDVINQLSLQQNEEICDEKILPNEHNISEEDNGYFSMPRKSLKKEEPDIDNIVEIDNGFVANINDAASIDEQQVTVDCNLKLHIACQTLCPTTLEVGCQTDDITSKQLNFKDLACHSKLYITNKIFNLNNRESHITKSGLAAMIPHFIVTSTILNGQQDTFNTTNVLVNNIIPVWKKYLLR